MSFSLSVYAPEWPNDLARLWPELLSRHGLVVEVCPGFDPMNWGGGFLPFRLIVTPGSFGTAERYGSASILAGFELDFRTEDPADLEEVAVEAVPEAAVVYRKSRCSAQFVTPMGRTVADLRLQCYAAATLALAAGGVVSDGQQGKDFVGEMAIENAAREADSYEQQPVTPQDWELTPFPGWAALEPPE